MSLGPLELLGQSMSFSLVTFSHAKSFHKVTLFSSQGKAVQMVPWRKCCAWSSPSWFP